MLKSPGAVSGLNASSIPGLKAQRTTTGAITPGLAQVTLTWTTPFADANYTVCASLLDATASAASLQIIHIQTQTASQVSVLVQNTAAGPLTGTLQCIAIHD